MFGRLRHWAGAGAAIAGLALGVSAAPGYLPAVGPVALRFRPAAQPATNLVRMPLPPPDPPPAAPPALPAADSEAKTNTPAVVPASAPAVSTVTGNPDEGAIPPGTQPLISPQMLLRYFNRSTNGVSSGIMAPVDFAPPPPPKPPASTATYSTDPK
jgi:hypothetical protein